MPVEMSELGNQFATATVAVFLLEHLKVFPWFRWLNAESAKPVKVAFGFVMAVLSTVGITYTFDYDPSSGGQFLVMIPSLHVLWTMAVQWVWQEIAYRKLVKA